MPVRVTMVFKNTTIPAVLTQTPRVSKWTERHYCATESVDDCLSIITGNKAGAAGQGLIGTRAALLSNDSVIERVDLQPWSSAGGYQEQATAAARPVALNQLGKVGSRCDFPQQGILFRMELEGGQPATPRFIIRGVPDEQVTSGELAYIKTYRADIGKFLGQLYVQFGTFSDNRLGAGGIGAAILTITNAGVVTGTGNILFAAANTRVKILQTRDSIGRRIGGIFTVASVNAAAGTVTLRGWTAGLTTGGVIRAYSRVFSTYKVFAGEAIAQALHKVGSPKDYRGANRRKRR